jgi:hypothetical protein
MDALAESAPRLTVEAIRGFWEDWLGAYEEYEMTPEEILDLGTGVVLS